MDEELLILRLPPRLAARIGARIDKYDRSRGDPAALLKRRRKKGQNSKDDARQTLALIQAIWGEDGILDYDSLNKAEDLLFLDSTQDQEGAAEQDDNHQRDDRDSEMEDWDESGDAEVDYWRVEGKNYIFKYGEDEYYATLVNLPCITEVQKTTDNVNVYKTGDIGQMLLVHDTKVSSGLPHPEIDPADLHEGVYAHGLTPPMRRVGPDRFARVSPAARRAENNLSMQDVRKADDLLFEFKELVLQKHKKGEAPVQAKFKKGQGSSGGHSTVFMFEEIVDAEPWMEFAEDVIVVEQGNDQFKTSTKKAQSKAWETKSFHDERKKGINKPTNTQPTNVPFDAVAALKSGSIGWAPSLISASLPPVSLAAPPMPVSMKPAQTSTPTQSTTPTALSSGSPIPKSTTPEIQSPSPLPASVDNSRRIAELQSLIANEEAQLSFLDAKMLRDRKEQTIAGYRAELRSLQEGDIQPGSSTEFLL